MRRPRAETEAIEFTDEIFGFLDQSNISEKNRARLRVLSEHDNPEVRELALLVEDIASIKPGRKKRVEKIAERRPDIFSRMVQLLPDAWWDNFWADRMDIHDVWLSEQWLAAKEGARG